MTNTKKKKMADSNAVGQITFREVPNAQQAAVAAAQDYLKTTLASGAPAPVVEYAQQRLAAATAGKPAKPKKSTSKVAPATNITISAADLTQLIASAEAKLSDLKSQNYVRDNAQQAQRNIDACRAGIAGCDVSIKQFDKLIEEALARLDASIEAPVGVGLWGAPQVADATARWQGLAIAFGAQRAARWRQVQSRTTLEARLADLER
jgi:hypothetical protein